MVGNVRNMGLTSLDDLFKSEQERQQDTHERILNIPVGEIYPYARQPYSIKRPTPDLVRLMDSIEQVGGCGAADRAAPDGGWLRDYLRPSP